MADAKPDSGDAGGRPGAAGSDDEMRRRVPGSRLKLWVLLNASRWVVAAVVLAGLFTLFVAVGALDPTPLRDTMGSKDPLETLFQALVTAVITGVTLVVTINQLVLSQELGAVGDQRDRMRGAMEFRRDVEAAIDRPVSPADPAAFLRAIVERSRSQARSLRAALPEDAAEGTRREVEAYVGGLEDNADAVSESLADAQFGTFDVLMGALDYNYSLKIYQARRLAAEHDDLGDPARAAIDDLVETLSLFGPAREHFKTLYFQWELIDLSRAVLYAAVPALAVTVPTVLYVDAGTLVGTTFGVDNLVWFASAATTVALAPFVLLLSYILRIATVAKRTLAIGPFVLRDADGTDARDEG